MMMKNFLLSIIFLFFTTVSYSQLASGSIAPNWTMTDLDGNSHTLYNYLNEGKVVFLIFSATWCGPCWNYHNNPAMKDFYNTYGPDGTDEAMVFFIEADTSTPLDALHGVGNTQGNWVAGTPFPIINMPNSSVAGAYQINYFPTVYGVYPNRRITEVSPVPLPQLVNFFNGRRLAEKPFEIDILEYDGARVACGDEVGVNVSIQNYGTESLTALEINIINKASGESIENIIWEGTLATYDFASVGTSVQVEENLDLIIEIYEPGTEPMVENRMEISLFSKPEYFVPSLLARFVVRTDGNGHQTRYEVRNSKGTVLFEQKNLENNKTYESIRNLSIGECYSFTIFDSAGNGLSGGGFFQIQDNVGNVIFEGKEFESEFTVTFQRGMASSINNIAANVEDVRLFPVPAAENLNLSFSSAISDTYNFTIRNIDGKIMGNWNNESLPAGEFNKQFNISNYPDGMYILTITDSNMGIVSKPFSILK